MSQRAEYPVSRSTGEDEPLDPVRLQAVKDIFVALARVVSALKLFPDNNEMVIRFRREFTSQLLGFLVRYVDLEIEIRQNAFHYQGRPAWQDENVIRSLPYLFFKDGMKKLTFLPGLSAEEIAEFLGMIRALSLLPLEVSDSVDALWQKDFANIQFYASDEFLESKVTVDHKVPLQFQVQKEELYRGRLDLQPEDAAEASQAARDRAAGSGPTDLDSPVRFAALNASDLQRLDSLLADERLATEEKDFLDLVLELLRVEERLDAFAEILAYLNVHHAIQVRNLDFVYAARLLKMMDPLARQLAGAAPERVKIFEKFRAGLGKNCPWDEVRKAAVERRIPEPKQLFDYLFLLGPSAIPLGTDLYEEAKDEDFRALARGFFERIGPVDPLALARQGQESHPLSTKAIIDVLGRIQDPRTIASLAAFLEFQDKSVRLKAIRALGEFSEPNARQILIRCLRDPDREVRTEAAALVRIGDHPELIRELIQLASDRGFRKKDEDEAASFLLALGKSQSEEARAFLAAFLRKTAFFGRSRLHAIQLGAVRALAAHGRPTAVEALASCARRGRRRLRPACREALERLASSSAAARKAIP